MHQRAGRRRQRRWCGAVSFTDNLEDAQFSVPELRAAVEEAEARGTYVTAHAHNVRGTANGLAAGVSCFEHVIAVAGDPLGEPGVLDDPERVVLVVKGGEAVKDRRG